MGTTKLSSRIGVEDLWRAVLSQLGPIDPPVSEQVGDRSDAPDEAATSSVGGFLLLDVPAHRLLLRAHRGHVIAPCPKLLPGEVPPPTYIDLRAQHPDLSHTPTLGTPQKEGKNETPSIIPSKFTSHPPS